VEAVQQAFRAQAAEVHVYGGAHHGFNCWAREAYHAPSAALAHGRALTYLAQHLF
jgi:carboxymethylenebutenolidase